MKSLSLSLLILFGSSFTLAQTESEKALAEMKKALQKIDKISFDKEKQSDGMSINVSRFANTNPPPFSRTKVPKPEKGF